MPPEYEYIDIDPANPPEMPCDAILSDQIICHSRYKKLHVEKLYGIVLIEDQPFFITKSNRWKYCKLRKEKTIDFRNRWVKIKTWAEMEKEYGLDLAGDIQCWNSFTKHMERRIPTNRIIFVTNEAKIKDSCYNITQEMISEILPIDYQPERELDDTVKRLWWIEEYTTPGSRVTDYAYTEKALLDLFPHLIKYSPGPIVPEEKEWRKI